ncbi:hypothetical protein NDU88_004446 [Pleurodeles waltl]|uniref:Uncharacterized protein n=1 Tax=Pleurodeles waltl TaxID=8319 RepID=A0AAV7M8E0_PLEWA|nr:hypothetical protein NDU88_004446 [Pleurodeles waltl]
MPVPSPEWCLESARRECFQKFKGLLPLNEMPVCAFKGLLPFSKIKGLLPLSGMPVPSPEWCLESARRERFQKFKGLLPLNEMPVFISERLWREEDIQAARKGMRPMLSAGRTWPLETPAFWEDVAGCAGRDRGYWLPAVIKAAAGACRIT